jgi:hypothetical protein
VPAFCVWSVDLCLAKGIGNDFGGGGGGGNRGGSPVIGTVIFTTSRLANAMGLNRSTPQPGRGQSMRESINGHPQNNMRPVHVLIDASPCEREAGVLSTGASLTVKCVIHRDRGHFYGFGVHLEFSFGCNPRRKDKSI